MSGASIWPVPKDVATLVPLMMREALLCEAPLKLAVGDLGLVIRSNSQHLLDRLKDYFSHLLDTPVSEQIEIIAIDHEVIDGHLPFKDWRREPGKQGRKDAYFDLPDGRLVLKVRTGMLFLQSETHRIAAGPCMANDNQLINFINSQVMNRLQQQDWLICHAAGLSLGDSTLAVAGFSGNGKSTLMLHLMEHPKSCYLTNDRLFLKAKDSGAEAVGIPKLPRINPGTVINNPRLASLIPEERREALHQLPRKELWDLEEKFDVDVARLYGPQRIDTSTPITLDGLLILNWSHTAEGPVTLQQIDLEERKDLLPALMKSPGPFYQDSAGRFLKDDDPQPESAYLQLLKDVAVFEVTGRMDFAQLTEICFNRW
ncbi:MAG: HprK-related kinase B [Candidatus Thiodiazotropha sp. (ex Notomyrtea botanica)]|nr:HprK-related kinase B [Candidatus Thiodiazotropha sp. (ex Notomyrtea botanica)]